MRPALLCGLSVCATRSLARVQLLVDGCGGACGVDEAASNAVERPAHRGQRANGIERRKRARLRAVGPVD